MVFTSTMSRMAGEKKALNKINNSTRPSVKNTSIAQNRRREATKEFIGGFNLGQTYTSH